MLKIILNLKKNEFHENLVDGYREIAEIFKERIFKVNAQRSLEDVTQDILKDLKGFIP